MLADRNIAHVAPWVPSTDRGSTYTVNGRTHPGDCNKFVINGDPGREVDVTIFDQIWAESPATVGTSRGRVNGGAIHQGERNPPRVGEQGTGDGRI